MGLKTPVALTWVSVIKIIWAISDDEWYKTIQLKKNRVLPVKSWWINLAEVHLWAKKTQAFINICRAEPRRVSRV